MNTHALRGEVETDDLQTSLEIETDRQTLLSLLKYGAGGAAIGTIVGGAAERPGLGALVGGLIGLAKGASDAELGPEEVDFSFSDLEDRFAGDGLQKEIVNPKREVK